MSLVDVEAETPETTGAGASDAQLVRRCLTGDELAWNALLDRYKRLIHSIPFKYGATADAAGDIFQAVCIDLVTELPKLRKPDALKAWLISVTRHKSLRWKTRARRERDWESVDETDAPLATDDPDASRVLEEAEREQAVRDALADLPPRCQELMRRLFYRVPPPSYAEVARSLGLATGSIGFIRGRCLKKLEGALKVRGY